MATELPQAGTLDRTQIDPAASVQGTTDELRKWMDEFECHKDMLGKASGVALLDAEGYLAFPYLSGEYVRDSLLAFDGEDSGIDADLLDGKQGDEYQTLDGTRAFNVTAPDILTVNKITPETDVTHNVLSIRADAPSGRAQGYGGALLYRLSDAAGALTDAARVAAVWDDPAAGAADARLDFETVAGGTLFRAASLAAGVWEMPEVAPSGAPPAGYRWLWFDDAAGDLKVRPNSGPDITLGVSSGVPPHNHDSLYLRLDGSSGMAADLDLANNSLLLTSDTAPGSPATAGDLAVYAESDQLKYKRSDGTVITVANTPTLHADFPDLGSDHHPQYQLSDPVTDSVLNSPGDDVDWRWNDAAGSELLVLDAGDAAVGLGVTLAEVQNNFRVFTKADANRGGLNVEVVGGTGINVIAGDGLGLSVSSLGDGLLGQFQRNSLNPTTSAVVEIVENSNANASHALQVQNFNPTVPVAKFISGNTDEILTVGGPELVVNEAGGNCVLRVEGATSEYLLCTNPTSDTVAVNSQSLATGRLNVEGGALDGLFSRTTTNGKAGVHAEGSGQAHGVVALAAGGNALDAEASSGMAAYLHRNEASAANPLVVIDAENATDAGALLQIKQGGTGRLLECEDLGTYTLGAVGSAAASERGGILEFKEFSSGATVPNPASGYYRLFIRDGTAVFVDSSGGEASVGAGGGVVTSPGGVEMKPDHAEVLLSTNNTVSFLQTLALVPTGAIMARVIVRNVVDPSQSYNVGIPGADTMFGTNVGGGTDDDNLDVPSAVMHQVTTPTPIIISTTDGLNWPNNSGRIRVTVLFFRFTIT